MSLPQHSNPFSLAGHSALITGSTQGVGAAIAIALAHAGANVCIHGLQQDDEAERVISQCRDSSVTVGFVAFDLASADETAIDRFYEEVKMAMPDIDLLVNNAGTYIDLPFLEMTRERYQRTMRLNVESGFFLTQQFARDWVSRSIRGRVLFTGSINGVLAEPTHVAYDASKGAVSAMVRSLCVSLAPEGIRVNAVAPGLVRTPLTNTVLSHDQQTLDWMRLHTPNGTVPDASVCGGAAVFLLSAAAEHIHGQTLLIDGGMSVWQQPDLPDAIRKNAPNNC
jgi:NAD(P)-dependent dehydrogenase (short-subunit alcohol dehydrogenase family)